ncbi:MAG: peptide-methionine (S)-S-oxide reductase MsrA [Candidatus Eremiobacteraeota bacterium]|nr:peptide-methionine (S)-S-oxide reductase MsrA [Candidatus Eremiobacteraeota bacterium]
MDTQTATFAAGCFWGVEAAFRRLPGVIDVVPGYTGGHVENPTYRQVCGGSTGHAEGVRVTFDAQRIRYDRLLEEFWQIHDPTQLNRQGPDVGDQYRSAIFTENAAQNAAAVASRDREQARRARKIVTQIAPATKFWPAEEYHQRYLEKHGAVTCHVPAQ